MCQQSPDKDDFIYDHEKYMKEKREKSIRESNNSSKKTGDLGYMEAWPGGGW